MNNEEKILQILTQMQKDIAELKQGQSNLEKEVQTVKNTTIIIENEHGKKLDALFDGYSQMYDVTKEIRMNVAELQNSQEKQELHIKWLDSFRKAE